MKKKFIIAYLLAGIIGITGCEKAEEKTVVNESDSMQILETEYTEASEEKRQETEGQTEALKPSKEQVTDMRAFCLEGMTDEEMDRLCENIKVANQTLENAYFYDNLFERLSDPDNLYWNYIDEKGEIIIGYGEDGQPVTTYNRFDAQNFIDLMEEMKDSLNSDALKPDLDSLISNMEKAKEMHDVEYIKEIFHILHDMDYYLLRYAPEDLAPYVTDQGMIAKYYGVLQVYENEQNAAAEDRSIKDVGPIMVQNSGWEYYNSAEKVSAAERTLSLQLVSEEQNTITDDEEWFVRNGLDSCDFPYEDENYFYETSGYNAFDTYLLILTNKQTNETVTLDFSEYTYADEYVENDYAFIAQRIIYARVKDDILYVATGHNTYASSCPHTAYITAIDMTDYHVIWKTEPLTCNSYSFALVDDCIICGYGMTDEDDYLKIVDMHTGLVTEEIPIRTMAEYIIPKEDKLYVRTYNMNYVFDLVMSN